MTNEAALPRKIRLSPHANRFNLREYRVQDWFVTPEIGTNVEDMLNPEYWAHVAGRMKPLDNIEVYAEDGSFFARLIVLSCNRVQANVQLLFAHKLGGDEAVDVTKSVDDSNSLEYGWGGPVGKHRVVRKSDKQIIKDGFTSKQEALDYIRDYSQATA